MAYYGIKSLTSWETSYFGGFQKVLLDHPDISLDMKMDVIAPKGNHKGLSPYLKEKMAKLFLLRVQQKGLADMITIDPELFEKSFFGRTKKCMRLNKKWINHALKLIQEDANHELFNLFHEYEEVVLNTSYEMTLPNDKEDEDDSDEAAQRRANRASERYQDAMSQIKIRKAFYGIMKEGVCGDLKDSTTFINVRKAEQPMIISPDVKVKADNLVKMLDITMDPEIDKISNLKAGKLNVVKLAEVPAGNTHVYYRVEENQTTRPFSICILMDESGSMEFNRGDGDNNIQAQNDLVKVLYTAFSSIMPADKIFVYGHTGDSVPEIHVYNDHYHPHFEYTIDEQFDISFCENYDGPVIECVYERVRKQTSDNILFISISDGQPSGEGYGGYEAIQEMKRVIEKCKRDGFVTVGVGLAYNAIADIYNYYTVIKDNTQLVKSVSTLVNRVVKSEFQD